MPKKLHDCVNDVMSDGKSEDSAWPICQDSIKEADIMKQILETKFNEKKSGCGCQKNQKTPY